MRHVFKRLRNRGCLNLIINFLNAFTNFGIQPNFELKIENFIEKVKIAFQSSDYKEEVWQ